MIVYWLLFAFFAAGALIAQPRLQPAYSPGGGPPAPTSPRQPLAVLAIGVLATICVIGLRYRVGGDWFNYELIFKDTARLDFWGALDRGDPGYQVLNWVASQAGAGVWLVNLMGAAIFGWGLYRFATIQPAPWLAFAIAVPYLVIVVGMGYTRQSIAVGVLMAGLASRTRGGSIIKFAIYVAVAATFHRTAVVVFPIAALAGRGSHLARLLLVAFGSVLLYDFYMGEEMSNYVRSYVDNAYSSQGAFMRVSMNMVAAIALWVLKDRLGFAPDEFKIWRNFALVSAASLVLLAFLPSTVVDRMALYLIPLQIAVLTRVALVGENRFAGMVGVLSYCLLTQFVWLNFGVYARYWVPYRLFPF